MWYASNSYKELGKVTTTRHMSGKLSWELYLKVSVELFEKNDIAMLGLLIFNALNFFDIAEFLWHIYTFSLIKAYNFAFVHRRNMGICTSPFFVPRNATLEQQVYCIKNYKECVVNLIVHSCIKSIIVSPSVLI